MEKLGYTSGFSLSFPIAGERIFHQLVDTSFTNPTVREVQENLKSRLKNKIVRLIGQRSQQNVVVSTVEFSLGAVEIFFSTVNQDDVPDRREAQHFGAHFWKKLWEMFSNEVGNAEYLFGDARHYPQSHPSEIVVKMASLDGEVKGELIKLAYDNPEIRRSLLDILQKMK